MSKTAAQAIDSKELESPFYGGGLDDDFELTAEEIALQNGEVETLGGLDDDPAQAAADALIAATKPADDDAGDAAAAAAAAEAAAEADLESDNPDGEVDNKVSDPDGEGEGADPAAADNASDPVPKVEDGTEAEAAGVEAEADAAADPAAGDEPGALMVPKWRFDQALQQSRKYKERLDAHRNSKKPAETAELDFDSLDLSIDSEITSKMSDAVLDGKGDELNSMLSQAVGDTVKKAMTQMIPGLENKIRSEMTSEIANTSTAQTEEMALSEAIENVYGDYPFLNPNDSTFNEEIMSDALAFQEGLMARGESPAAAVYAATKKALQIHKPEALLSETASSAAADKAAADATAAAAKAAADAAAADKSTAARAKAAKAAASQPAKAATEAQVKPEADLASINIDDLTDAEFEALPESTRAQLRGDFG